MLYTKYDAQVTKFTENQPEWSLRCVIMARGDPR